MEGKSGQELIDAGKVGALLMAGGLGSRLGHEGPKGTFPVFEGKTLFDLFAEKVLLASERAGRPLPVGIMTCPENHEATVAYFEKFDMSIHFFSQGEQCGNGLLFERFWASEPNWNVEFLTTVVLDNVLAEPFDAELVGQTADLGVDVTVKVTERASIDEKVGVVVETPEGIRVVEYGDTPIDLSNRWANLSLFCVTTDFSKRVRSLPFHSVKGGTRQECFLFDMLELAKSVSLLAQPRERCFVPLKSREDLEFVRSSLSDMAAAE